MQVLGLEEQKKLSLEADKKLERMRPCVRELMRRKVKGKGRYDARHFITAELKRVGFSQEETIEILWGWQGRYCEPRFPMQAVDQFVQDYVRWAYEHNTNLRCGSNGALKREGICFRAERACEFYEKMKAEAAGKREASQWKVGQFYDLGWDDYLRENEPRGEVCVGVYECLLEKLAEEHLTYEDPIYMSYAKLAQAVSRKRGVRIDTNSAFRAIKRLEQYGLIKKVKRGSRSRSRRQANEYRIALPLLRLP